MKVPVFEVELSNDWIDSGLSWLTCLCDLEVERVESVKGKMVIEKNGLMVEYNFSAPIFDGKTSSIGVLAVRSNPSYHFRFTEHSARKSI